MSGCLPCTELARADHVRSVVPDSELAEEVVLRHRDEKSWILHARPRNWELQQTKLHLGLLRHPRKTLGKKRL